VQRVSRNELQDFDPLCAKSVRPSQFKYLDQMNFGSRPGGPSKELSRRDALAFFQRPRFRGKL